MNLSKYRIGKSILLVLLVMLMILSGASFAMVSKTSVASIQPLALEVEHLKAYALPKTVVATMKDKTEKSVSVLWSPSKVDTSKIGNFTYKGSVKGTTLKAIMTIKVVPGILSVEKLTTTIGVNGVVALPQKVKVILKNKKTEERIVKWSSSYVDTSKVGTIITSGTINGSSLIVQHTANIIKNFTEVENLSVSLKVKDSFSLPKEVFGTGNKGEAGYTPVRWLVDNLKIDTSVSGTFNIQGLAIGYDQKVNAVITIKAVIESIENKNFTLYANDIYSIPKEVTVMMNDGSTKSMAVVWVTPLPNLKVRGSYEIFGNVDEFPVPVKYTYKVKSDFFTLQKSINFTQWGYIPIAFSKELSTIQDPSKVILKDSAGVQIVISKLVQGTTDKKALLIIPSRPLQKGLSYSLILPVNSIASTTGDTNDEEFVFNLNY